MTNSNCQDDEKKSLHNQDSDDWSELRSIIKTEKEEQQVIKNDEEKTPSKTAPLKGILKKTTPPPTPETETPLTNGKKKKKRKTKASDLDETISLLLAKVKKEKESESESEKTPRRKKKVVANGT